MLRLTESSYRGQCWEHLYVVCVSDSGRDGGIKNSVCVQPCVDTIDMEAVMWRSDHDLGSLPPEGSSLPRAETVNFPTCVPESIFPPSRCHVDDTDSSSGDGEGFLFFSGWHGLKSYFRQGVILSELEPGLPHTWMDSLHLSRPLKSVWVISCQGRWEQQQIGLLKQFSLTGRLLSACQRSDYSIQLPVCRSCRAEPHGYLSIPDTLTYTVYWCSTKTVHRKL